MGEDAELFNPDREFKDNEIWDNDVYMFYNPASERFSPLLILVEIVLVRILPNGNEINSFTFIRDYNLY